MLVKATMSLTDPRHTLVLRGNFHLCYFVSRFQILFFCRVYVTLRYSVVQCRRFPYSLLSFYVTPVHSFSPFMIFCITTNVLLLVVDNSVPSFTSWFRVPSPCAFPSTTRANKREKYTGRKQKVKDKVTQLQDSVQRTKGGLK